MEPDIYIEATEVPVIRQRKSKTLARLKKLKAQKAHDQPDTESASSNKSPRLEDTEGAQEEDTKKEFDGHDGNHLDSEKDSHVTTHQTHLLEASQLTNSNDQPSQNSSDAKPPWHEEDSSSDEVVMTGSSLSKKVSLDVESLTSNAPAQSVEDSAHDSETGQSGSFPEGSRHQSDSEKECNNVGSLRQELDHEQEGDSVGSVKQDPSHEQKHDIDFSNGLDKGQTSEHVDQSAVCGHGQKEQLSTSHIDQRTTSHNFEILEDIKESDEDVTDSDDDLLCIGRSSSTLPSHSGSHNAVQQEPISVQDQEVEPTKEVSEDEAIGSASSEDGFQPLEQSVLKEANIPATNVTCKNQTDEDKVENTEMEISSSGGPPSDMSIPGTSLFSSEPSPSCTESDLVGRTYSEPPLGSTSSLAETNRSFVSTGALPPITTQSARRNQKRSYLMGGLRNTGSLLGKEELERNLPDRKIRVFVSTWNMHEEKVLPNNLEDLVLPEESDILQDIYVIGTQESTPDVNEWAIRTQETLGTTHILLHKASLGVLHLLIFIRRDLYWFCSPVEEDSISTRPGSRIKTKGAVAVSFTFFGTSLLFIVSHFTSGDDNLSNRIQDYAKIIRSLDLPIKVPPTRKYNVDKDDITTRFDAVFWCGDFNFRLMESRAKVENWALQLKEGNIDDYDVLLQHDQLRKSMTKNEKSKVEYTADSIFKGFQEGEISFLPTYKYNPGEDVFDTSSKARIPSYTDRVLFKPRKGAEINVLFYNSCPTIRCSDHRPVYGIYEVKIRPGRDDVLCGTPSFAKDVFVEANRRRAAASSTGNNNTKGTSKSQKSAICSVM